jgi:hypothetical protein
MKDLVGKEVQLGDSIAFRHPNPDRDLGGTSDTLVIGTIEHFTKKGMRVKYSPVNAYMAYKTPRVIDGMLTKHLYDNQFVKVS